jgi:hypothetical protein
MAFRRLKAPLVVHPRSKFPAYDLELLQWRQAVKDKISQYRTEFWESQREVEDRWLANYNAKLLAKHKVQQIKRKESVIRIAKHTQDLLAAQAAERKAQKEIEGRRAAHKREVDRWTLKHIQAMNLNVRNWFTPENMEKNLKESLVLPTAIDQSIYYSHLRTQTLMADMGKIEGVTDYYNNRTETLLRNTLLIPVFANLKSLIKHLTYTPAHALEIDYASSLQLLVETGRAEEAELKELRQKYIEVYEASLTEQSEVYLAKVQRQLNLLLQLLRNWQQYVGVLKLDDLQAASLAELQFPKTTEAGSDAENAEPSSDDYDTSMPEHLKNPAPEETEELEPEMSEDAEKPVNSVKVDLLHGGLYEQTFTEEDKNVILTDFSMYSGEPLAEPPVMNEEESWSMLELLMESMEERGIATAKELFGTAHEFPEPNRLKPIELGVEHNPSFTLEALRVKVQSMTELTPEESIRQHEILESIQYLTNYKVEEPQLLMKVFGVHRYKPVRF